MHRLQRIVPCEWEETLIHALDFISNQLAQCWKRNKLMKDIFVLWWDNKSEEGKSESSSSKLEWISIASLQRSSSWGSKGTLLRSAYLLLAIAPRGNQSPSAKFTASPQLKPIYWRYTTLIFHMHLMCSIGKRCNY